MNKVTCARAHRTFCKPISVMHDIEPHFTWRDHYVASEDERSPFFGRHYDEFYYTQKIYNYYIHPQWDNFGSQTLYTKVLYADYEEGFAVLEFIGEWNDCLYNDVMYLKREVIEPMMEEGIFKFLLVCENVLNFHGSDDCYYEEWLDEAGPEGGWIVMLNVMPHVEEELKATRLQYFVHFGEHFNQINWRAFHPRNLGAAMEKLLQSEQKGISY